MSALVRRAASSLPLALTMGEPAGVGPEISAKAWASGAVPPFFVIGDPEVFEGPVQPIARPQEALACFPRALPVLPCRLPARVELGRPNPANAIAVIRAIELAVDLVVRGEAAAVVTNPIQKAALIAAGFAYPGHTEFLAALAGGGVVPVMMLACPELRVIPITVHVPLSEAIGRLDQALIVQTGRIVARDLALRFGLPRPRLAFSGLNPHAGEAGRMGREEINVISDLRSRPCRRRASRPRARFRPTPCSTPLRGAGTTSPFACTTTRR